jgi:hypothetical protein
MIVDVPLIEEISKLDLDEIDDMLKRAGPDIYRIYTNLPEEAPAKRWNPTPVKIQGAPRFLAWVGVGAALSTLATVLALASLVQVVIQYVDGYSTPKTRRRKRTEICVARCLGILKNAGEEVKFMNTRALETDDSAKRTRRKFQSRA